MTPEIRKVIQKVKKIFEDPEFLAVLEKGFKESARTIETLKRSRRITSETNRRFMPKSY